jgi:hypothetical protein
VAKLPEMMVRTSERTSFKRCRWQWKWGYKEQINPNTPNRHLRFGLLVHEAFAKFYKPGIKRGPHPAKTFAVLVAEDEERYGPLIMRDSDDYDKQIKGLDLGIAMLKGYVETYGKDDRYEVISPEMPFSLDVHDSRGRYLFTYVGTMDGVVRDRQTKRIGLLEHKTGRSLTLPAPLALDEQAGSYWAYAPDYLAAKGILEPGEELDFILYNFLKKSMPDDRPRNEEGLCLNMNGTVSKRQPQPLFRRELVYRSPTDRANLMRRAREEAREIRKARNGQLALYKNPGEHCNWCAFKDMCEVHESGNDWRAIRDAMFTPWRPYEVHDLEVTV